jgi:hypothetical protein
MLFNSSSFFETGFVYARAYVYALYVYFLIGYFLALAKIKRLNLIFDTFNIFLERKVKSFRQKFFRRFTLIRKFNFVLSCICTMFIITYSYSISVFYIYTVLQLLQISQMQNDHEVAWEISAFE